MTRQRPTLTPTYDSGGGLMSLELDGTPYIERMAHDARGQRTLCVLGNGVMIRYRYDPGTFRLARLRSEPCAPTGTPPGWRPSGRALQDHAYGRDPVGNILLLLDATPGGGVPPNPADPLARRFTYDALYRLTSATGRETDLPPPSAPWLDNPTRPDTTAVRRYTERYVYDAVGNLLSLTHHSQRPSGPSTPTGRIIRTFTPVPGSNRLQTLTIANTTYPYTYDASGNLTSETLSRLFESDHANRLATYRTQAAPTSEPSVLVAYRYDANGHRVLKLVRNQGGQVRSTVYIDGLFERLVIGSGLAPTRHDTLHVKEGDTRIALVQIGPPPSVQNVPPVLYQLADHLGSSELVLDATASFVSREEFLPYGETSHGGYARKRYRFIGRERDEETGLSYHEARYYASWLCRWTSCDPAGIRDGPNLYLYCGATPLRIVDGNGRQGTATDDDDMGEMSVGVVQTQLPSTPENVAIAKRLAERFASVPADRAGPAITQIQLALNRAGGVQGFAGVGREATGYKIFLERTHFVTRQEMAAMEKQALIGLVMLGVEYYAMASMVEGLVGLLAEYAAASVATVSLEEMAAFEATARQLAERAAVTDAERLLIEARFARNALARQVGASKATVVGAYDVASGRVVAAANGYPGLCAEDFARQKLVQAGVPESQIRFTEAIRPRTLAPVDVCRWCQISYKPNQFTPLTGFESESINALAPLLP